MDVLDPADVVDLVDEDAATERLALDVADQVALVMRSIDPRVGIEHFHVEHRRVLASHGDGVGIGAGRLVRLLLGVVQHDALERAVGVERDEGRPALAARPLGDQEGRAVVGRLRESAVADPVVGGDRFPDACQRDRRGHVQVPCEEVRAPRRQDLAAASLGRGIHRLLEGRRVVVLAVSLRPEISDVERVGNGLPPGRRAEQQQDQSKHRESGPSHRLSFLSRRW